MPIDIPKLISTRPKPAQYIMEDALRKAVEVALAFNQPLLLTGEPGTGKTLLAYKLADMLHEKTKADTINSPRFAATPLRFNTKTTAAARDLFYTYDAIGHFQNANIKRASGEAAKTVKDFIELQALGKAIALANPKAEYTQYFNWPVATQAQSSVVLIDEIDKAPRDFSNDILNEIERLEFFIREQDNFQVQKGENSQRILVLMTSNSEKNLPDAFLRRCVFYHIAFPNPEKLQQILKAQLSQPATAVVNNNLERITDLFEQIRKAAIRKKPATAELVAFVKLLEMDGLLTQANPDRKAWFINNLSLLAKTKEDIDAISTFLKNN